MDKLLEELNIHNHYELELRAGFFNNNYFTPGVHRQLFFILLNLYSEQDQFTKSTESYTFEYLPGHIRKRIYEDGKRIEFVKKESISKIDLKDESLRVALSSEEILNNYNNYQISKEISTRIRYSFKHSSGLYQIDLSKTTKNGKDIYEYEVEFLKPPIIDDLKGIINHTSKQLEYYRRIILDFQNYKIKPLKPTSLKRWNIPYLQDYLITNKFDGTGYFLYFHKSGIVLINNTHIKFFQKSIPSLLGTVLHGEYLDDKKEFIAFDALFYNGRNISYSNLPDRIKYIEYVNKYISNDKFSISKFAEFADLKNSINFALQNKNIIDGLIFTPKFQPYRNNATYKWKEQIMTTIDFAIAPTRQNNIYTLLSVGYDGTLIPFATPNNTEFKTLIEDPLFLKATVIEFMWENNKFIPFRTRPDKITPNFITVAQSVWEDIQKPLFPDELIKLSSQPLSDDLTYGQIVRRICWFLNQTQEPRIFEGATKGKLGKVKNMFKNSASDINLGNNIADILRKYFNN